MHVVVLDRLLSTGRMDSLASFLLYVGLCVGHTVLLLAHMNWWYGIALPWKIAHSLLRVGTALSILAGYAVFGWWWYRGVLAPEGTYSDPASLFYGGYVGICLVLGYVVFPLITVTRLLRRPPAHLIEERSTIVDVAAKLGYKPVAPSRRSALAYLPGNEIFRVDFVERTLALPDLPTAWDGLRILHVTDVHFRGAPDRAFYRYVLERCNAWHPDLVTVTGDVVDSKRHHRWVVPLLGRLRHRYGAFAILGNHDYWYDPPRIRRRLRRIRMQVLDNRWEQIDVRGEPMIVIGHEGPWFRPAPALEDCPQGPFRLCLSHTPDNIAWARQAGIHLMLSGHNHGGQVRFPIIGSAVVPSRYGRKYDCGTFAEGPTLLHVCRGLAAQHPVRYNCRPEVVLLILRCAGQVDSAEARRS